MSITLNSLQSELKGELLTSQLMRQVYATDASVYRELPLAVVYPREVDDLRLLIRFAAQNGIGLIPRAAGTSLAGQCVGSGIVVDISRHFTRILELDVDGRWVRVQPGVIRDELNRFLKPHGLRFGPDTSTANRCMIGGMVGNNSCGMSSIVYGSTRDHLLEAKALLSDGSEVVFGPLDEEALREKLALNTLEGKLYRQLMAELSEEETRARIISEYPKPEIHRRNTGYAVDLLLRQQPFNPGGPPLNLCTLLAGSEGTLAFVTEVKLNLVPEPPDEHLLLCVHFDDVLAAMRAVVPVMKSKPFACEIMDKVILDCTKDNPGQRPNRFFVQGDPAAILVVEYRGTSASAKASRMIDSLRSEGLGYAWPIVEPPHTHKVWNLRKAGLGLLGNLPGDAKAVACIEDTAVAITDLADYIGDFTGIMERYGQKAVYYAHAGAGEIHLRPILNLKKEEDVVLFRKISEEVAGLVKRYRGALSGEHGDGRVRAEFLPKVIGKENYELLRRIKQTWDPKGIFNPGKIVDAPPMDTSLRYEPGQTTPDYKTLLDFSRDGGILRHVEKCNGSGDCRKLPTAGGTMCPSYHATRTEMHTTRARANALREILSRPQDPLRPFDSEALIEVLDLCLSCKACASECPSTVDMAALKAEVMYQYQLNHGFSLRNRLFAGSHQLYRLGRVARPLANALMTNPFAASVLKKAAGIHPRRSLPPIPKETWRGWFNNNENGPAGDKEVYLFCDEFTNYTDPAPGIATVKLLRALGYRVSMPECEPSGRAHISKGLLHKAKELAEKNVLRFAKMVTADKPLVGVEPSAMLSFRDEYPRLVDAALRSEAEKLAENALTLEEFLHREFQAGRIDRTHFTKQPKKLLLHGHCHHKALANVEDVGLALSIPEHYEVELIQAGCCGMAGSFGYEKEHYEVSMAVAQQSLLPAISAAGEEVQLVAQGTSCRHQIQDASGRLARHPAEILFEALEMRNDE
ncbi:MAG: FAD-binding oxidoreductase [Saprospirales bacterium]|nr:FAD-binding oxidoreductase [Saprospirales bacterium]